MSGGRMRARVSGDDGFTLVELLVVVAILAILAAVAIPTYLRTTAQADDAAVKTDIAALKKAVMIHAVGNDDQFIAVSALKKDGYPGASIDYPAGGAPSYATASGPTASIPATKATSWCIAATSPSGVQFYATESRSVTAVGGSTSLCG